MRSSKSRSRNKNNRNRSMGNIVNRVFDSSGPEGKVRGTPQQIIDKYLQLARDAQLGNDRVAAENFQQHAEHYTRMLGEAMRDQEARREAQDVQQPNVQQSQNRPRNDRDQNQNDPGSAPQPEFGGDPQMSGDSNVFDAGDNSDNGLVETPEMTAAEAPKPRQRRPRRPKNTDEAGQPESSQDKPPQEAAE